MGNPVDTALRHAFAAIVLAAGVAATSPPAIAALIERDLAVAGDKLITFDTLTSLEWLDLSPTTGKSYDLVAAGYGGYTTAYGFSFATLDQVHILYEDAGLANTSGAVSLPNYPTVLQMHGLMGCTNDCSTNSPYSIGYAEQTPFSPTHVGFAMLRANHAGGSGIAATFPDISYGILKYQSLVDYGSYLVRPGAVPEPAALALLVVALGGLGLTRRKRAWERRRDTRRS